MYAFVYDLSSLFSADAFKHMTSTIIVEFATVAVSSVNCCFCVETFHQKDRGAGHLARHCRIPWYTDIHLLVIVSSI